MRKPLRLECGRRGRRGRRDDRRFASVAVVLAVVAYGLWVWRDAQGTGMPAWLLNLRGVLGAAGTSVIAFATVAVLLLVVAGMRSTLRRPPPRGH